VNGGDDVQRTSAVWNRWTSAVHGLAAETPPRPARGQSKPSDDYETVRIPPLMSRKTLGILDGGRDGDVDRSCRRRGIKGKVK